MPLKQDPPQTSASNNSRPSTPVVLRRTHHETIPSQLPEQLLIGNTTYEQLMNGRDGKIYAIDQATKEQVQMKHGQNGWEVVPEQKNANLNTGTRPKVLPVKHSQYNIPSTTYNPTMQKVEKLEEKVEKLEEKVKKLTKKLSESEQRSNELEQWGDGVYKQATELAQKNEQLQQQVDTIPVLNNALTTLIQHMQSQGMQIPQLEGLQIATPEQALQIQKNNPKAQIISSEVSSSITASQSNQATPRNTNISVSSDDLSIGAILTTKMIGSTVGDTPPDQNPQSPPQGNQPGPNGFQR